MASTGEIAGVLVDMSFDLLATHHPRGVCGHRSCFAGNSKKPLQACCLQRYHAAHSDLPTTDRTKENEPRRETHG